MRILYATLENMSLHKGSVVHVKEVVHGLRKLGHHVGLIANSSHQDGETTHFYNLSVMPSFLLRLCRMKKQPHIISLVFLFLFLLRILPQYDIIYARDYHAAIIALLPRIFFRKKLVLEINGIANEEQRLKTNSFLNSILVFLIRKAEKMSTRYSEKVISVAPKIKLYVTQHFNCPLDKIRVIANGVDTKKFHPIYDKPLLIQWKKRLGIESKDTVIAYVGNIAPWQGIDDLIEIAFGLLEKNKNLKFLIVGDGLLKPLLSERVSGSGYDGNIYFTGMLNHEEIPFLINLADICVAPLRVEGGSPIKVFEYMACGKPVITSRIEGLEFIEKEGAGCLTLPNDRKGLEEALGNLIKDPLTRMDMGQKALQIARERFSWETRVKEIEELLNNLA